MITIQASSIDELNVLWKRLRKDFQVIERIHLDQKSLQYRMVINRPDLTQMIKTISDKVLERIPVYNDFPLRGVLTFNQFSERIEGDFELFPSLEPIQKIWSIISVSDKKAAFAYLQNQVKPEAEIEAETILAENEGQD